MTCGVLQVFYSSMIKTILPTNPKSFPQGAYHRFPERKGIALFDTATAVRRLQDNASDKYLEVVRPTDISALLHQLPQCKAIVTTGQKATDTLCALFSLQEPKVGDFTEFISQTALCGSTACPLHQELIRWL